MKADTNDTAMSVENLNAPQSGKNAPNINVDASEAFCVRPWQQLGILPSGKARFCCLGTRLIRDETGAVSISTHDLETIWNADSIKKVRRLMLADEKPEECQNCYRAEQNTGTSARKQINKDFAGGFLNPAKISAQDFVEKHTEPDGRCDALPVDLDLEMNNTCNLACRMCSPDYSSKIESDEVQNRWRPRTSKSLKHDATSWDLLPANSAGVEYINIGAHFTDDRGIYVRGAEWSQLRTNTSKPVTKLAVWCNYSEDEADWFVSIIVGNKTYESGLVPGKITKIDIPTNEAVGECAITFQAQRTETTKKLDAPKNSLRINLHGVKIEFSDLSQAKRTNSTDAVRSWAGKTGDAATDFMSEIEDVQRLQLMGGEPLLLKETSAILKRLVESGQASKTVLSIVTNGTIWNKHYEKLIGAFKKAIITISLDGTGDCLEYIRHGAVWSKISTNIRAMNTLENSSLSLGPTLQIYNHRAFIDLFKFAEEEQIGVRLPWLTQPRYLSVDILPMRMKADMYEELLELRDSLHKGSSQFQNHKACLTSVLKELEIKQKKGADVDSIHEFMLYTNDLDLSRDQSFKQTFPKIVEDLDHCGFDWHDQTRHLKAPDPIEEVVYTKKHYVRNTKALLRKYGGKIARKLGVRDILLGLFGQPKK